MKFGIRRRPKDQDPAVTAAMDERDARLEDLNVAIEKVDNLQNEMIDEYRQANGVRRGED